MSTAVQGGVGAHQLECMEIWGGNRTAEDTVSVFGMDAWVLSLPCAGAEAGGDIHYVSMCGSGRIARFAVADVAGHGQAAAGLAVSLRRLMKKNINRVDQTGFARALNREFGRLSRDGSFATAVLTTYFAPTDHLIVCNAGHPAPLWYHASAGRWKLLLPDMAERVAQVQNLPLGVIGPTNYRQFAVSLNEGDMVLLYTDSLIEARNAEEEQLGEDAFLRLLARVDPLRPERFNRSLLASVIENRGGVPVEDDVTLLLLRHNAANPPMPSVGTVFKDLGKLVGLVRF